MQEDAPLLRIAATFVAEPLAVPLEYWAQHLDLPLVCQFASNNQILHELIDSHSQFWANQNGANLLLMRPADWHEPEDMALELIAAFERVSHRLSVPTILCVCPDGSEGQLHTAWALRLEDAVKRLSNVHVISCKRILETYEVDRIADQHAYELANIPYTSEFYVALATTVIRLLNCLQRKPYKVIVLDCDNTLWGGVVGEDGPMYVDANGPYAELQRFMLAKRNAGMLLCLCSKNVEADVDAVFEHHPNMPLKPEHITAKRVNWQSTSANVAELSQELGIGVDSFVYVDDNPMECAEVTAAFPGLSTICLPTSPKAIPRFLRHVWAFDQPPATAVDLRRAEMYREAVLREDSRKKSSSMAEFLEGLELDIEMHPLRQEDLPRAAQLTQRINQFNFSNLRLSASEMQRLFEASDIEVIAVNVKDRFGDYGFVGLVISHVSEEILTADAFMLSCRVLGRGVEHRMLANLAAKGLKVGCPNLCITHSQTAQNEPALQFLLSVAQPDQLTVQRNDKYIRHSAVLDCDALTGIRYRPDETPVTAKSGPQSASPGPSPDGRTHSPDYNAIASSLVTARAIEDAIGDRQRNPGSATTPEYCTPEGEIEQIIADIWCETLLVEKVDRNNNFFDLGGTSLKAVRMIARMRRDLGVDLSMEDFFGAPTVRELALVVRHLRLQVVSGVI